MRLLPFQLMVLPPARAGAGWEVHVYVHGKRVARSVENSHYEAAVIGAALAERATAGRSTPA